MTKEEAIKKIKEWDFLNDGEKEVLETLIPELAESEDEKHCKWIIAYLNDEFLCADELTKPKLQTAIAWLEKQGEKLMPQSNEHAWLYLVADVLTWREGIGQYLDDPRVQELAKKLQKEYGQKLYIEKQGEKMKANSEVIKDYTGEENVWNNAHDFRPKHMQRCLCYDKYMGGVYCYVYDNISKYWCTQTTEEHDPDGDNHICDYADYRVTVWMCLPKTTFYPQKQGEQKPADKVEPKFKVRNWIACEGLNTALIVNIDDDRYEVELIDGNKVFPHIDYIDRLFHLWTIADAKDGDVLAYETDEEDLWIMIYWSLYEPYEGHVHYHALLINDNFSDKGTCCIYINDLKPATKKQRDYMFEKMKEAGYEWNATKKELIIK